MSKLKSYQIMEWSSDHTWAVFKGVFSIIHKFYEAFKTFLDLKFKVDPIMKN